MEQSNDVGDRRELLRRQLDVAWGFAEGYVIGQIDEDLALWEPSAHACTVRQVLPSADLDRPLEWHLPDPQPFWFVAAWVNFELTKNLSEINHLKLLHANQVQQPSAGRGGLPNVLR